MHNGHIRDYASIKRDLVLTIDPELYPLVEGSTYSEIMFFMAMTLGLEEDPVRAVGLMVGLVEEFGERHGVSDPVVMTVATTDGERMWVFRYSSERKSCSLFQSVSGATLRDLYPKNAALNDVSEEAQLIVSEPLGGLTGDWLEVPESSVLVAQEGPNEVYPFTAIRPS